ncbi:MAG: DUF4234 domain-containing protein [Gammaproteobacteria bacterium]|nr:DUF4234 domain-containing protein [Gammaproteobacteria bacterium]
MEDESSNIYKAPESDLSTTQNADDVNNFERFSAWAVFGLSIITFGIYPLYWLFTRAKTVNTFHSNLISPKMIMATGIIFIINIVFQVLAGVYEENMAIVSSSALINLVYLVFYLILLFSLRNRIRDIIGKSVNPVFTFFASAIYLQYKINVAIDENE